MARKKKKRNLDHPHRSGHGPIQPERLADVAGLLVRRFTTGEIEQALAKQYNCSTRTVARYLRRVRDEWQRWGLSRPDAERAEETSKIRATFETVVRECVINAVGGVGKPADPTQWRYVITANRELARMNGDYIEKVEVASPGGGPLMLNMTVDQATQELTAALRAVKRIEPKPAPATSPQPAAAVVGGAGGGK